MTVSVSSPTLKARLFPVAKAASLIAALALVAQSEWALALAVGWPAWIAWAAPVALDAYILAAISAHRDLGPSVVVSAASVFGSHAVYAAPGAWEGAMPGVGHLIWPMAAACSVVPLLVTWRVHHLHLPEAETVAETVEPAAAPVAEPAPAAPEAEPEPVTSGQWASPLIANPTDRRVLAALDGKAMGMSELAREAGLPLSTTKNAVGRLVAAGHVVKDGTTYRRRAAA